MGTLSDGIIRSTMMTFLRSATKELTNGSLSLMHGAVEDIFRLAVSHGAADSAISSRVDSLTESQLFADSIAVCLMKKPPFTAPITRSVKRRAIVALANEEKFHEPCAKAGKENMEATPPSPLTENFSVWSS